MSIIYVSSEFQQGKKVRSHSGFKGKGFKFDETEAQLADERKKLQKAALGLHDPDDPDDPEEVDVSTTHNNTLQSFDNLKLTRTVSCE